MSVKRKRKGLNNYFFYLRKTVKSTNGKKIFDSCLLVESDSQAVYFPKLPFNYA